MTHTLTIGENGETLDGGCQRVDIISFGILVFDSLVETMISIDYIKLGDQIVRGKFCKSSISSSKA